MGGTSIMDPHKLGFLRKIPIFQKSEKENTRTLAAIPHLTPTEALHDECMIGTWRSRNMVAETQI